MEHLSRQKRLHAGDRIQLLADGLMVKRMAADVMAAAAHQLHTRRILPRGVSREIEGRFYAFFLKNVQQNRRGLLYALVKGRVVAAVGLHINTQDHMYAFVHALHSFFKAHWPAP